MSAERRISMIRRVIEIDEEKCNGCGICANACHEGAIGIVDGKAKLMRDDYCDGLGDCLPSCPKNAIHFVQREAAAYDEAAVKANMAKKQNTGAGPVSGGCPGSMARAIQPKAVQQQTGAPVEVASQLRQWPVQIQLAPIMAPYFDGADLLVATDCTAYAYGNFHQDFLKDHMVLIGCTKLDDQDYSEKLTEILAHNNIKSVTVTRMIVPCCGGMQYAVEQAIAKSGKDIPMKTVIISTDGSIVS